MLRTRKDALLSHGRHLGGGLEVDTAAWFGGVRCLCKVSSMSGLFDGRREMERCWLRGSGGNILDRHT